jgi:DNA-binding transcriptional regulator YiaG
VSIEDADALDRSIAFTIIYSHTRLRGQEVKFLRSLARLSQTELATKLGVKRITVARWEGARNTPIPGPADRVIRMVALDEIFQEPDFLIALMDMLPEITDSKPPVLVMQYLGGEVSDLFPEDKPHPDGWKPSKAA